MFSLVSFPRGAAENSPACWGHPPAQCRKGSAGKQAITLEWTDQGMGNCISTPLFLNSFPAGRERVPREIWVGLVLVANFLELQKVAEVQGN